MKTYSQLIDSLRPFPFYQRLQFLRDGSFLSQFDVSEDQVTVLCNDFESEYVALIDKGTIVLKKQLYSDKEHLRCLTTLELENYLTDLAFNIAEQYSDNQLFDEYYQCANDFVKNKYSNFWD